MSGKISKKQEEILNYIKEELVRKGYPPTVREICEAVHLKSTSSVHMHLETLEKNGYIRRDSSKTRAIEVIDQDFSPIKKEMLSIPLVGRVAAGEPILADEHIEDYFPIPSELLPRGANLFILEVHGESMINAGILDGDYVIVKEQNTARTGDMVVALIEDGATVKTFYREEGVFRLQPENDTMEPIIVADVTILGEVVGVFRLFR